MEKYFKNCKDLKEVYKTYKELVKKFHPDITGNKETTEIMQDINSQLAYIKAHGLEAYIKNKEASLYDKLKNDKESPLAQLIVLAVDNNLTCELVGLWLWISGDTKPYKDKLKELGARWSSKHSKWYYSPNPIKAKFKSKYKYSEIKQRYGSRSLNDIKKTSNSGSGKGLKAIKG